MRKSFVYFLYFYCSKLPNFLTPLTLLGSRLFDQTKSNKGKESESFFVRTFLFSSRRCSRFGGSIHASECNQRSRGNIHTQTITRIGYSERRGSIHVLFWFLCVERGFFVCRCSPQFLFSCCVDVNKETLKNVY